MAENNPVTYTSKPVMLSSLPEVSNISGKFFYNFFTYDERESESNVPVYGSSVSLSSTYAPSALTDKSLLQYYSKSSKYPRVNAVTIVPPEDVKTLILSSALQIELLKKLTYVNASSAFKRIGLSVTNTKIEKDISNILTSSMMQDSNVSNSSATSGDNASVLAKLVSPMNAGYVYSDAQADEITSKLGSAFAGISFNTSLLANVSKELINGSITNYKNIHVEELISSISSVSSAQDEAIAADPYNIRVSDFEEALPAIKIERIYSQSSTRARELNNYLVGFVVEKYSLNFDGSIKIYDTLIYTKPDYLSFTDTNISYGRSYRYRVRCIYACELEATLETSNNITGVYKITVPFVSNGKDVVIDCTEQVAPPPPTDLRFRYQGEGNGVSITWQFPVNMQRDIKKFQIYRRRSIDEPFQLLRVFDFDDSIIKTEDPDQIPSYLITKSLLPVTMYRDKDFTKDSKFIYAIIAVDAHGLSSNFSVQIEVTYDKYRNRLINRLISRSNAPRPYPNIYLNVDTFVDTMKLSGYKKLNIYFDPDYAKVQQTDVMDDGTALAPVDLDHIVFTTDDSGDNDYKLMIVNTDMQKSQTVSIKIVNNYLQPSRLEGTTSQVYVGYNSPDQRGTSSGPVVKQNSTSTTSGPTGSRRDPSRRTRS